MSICLISTIHCATTSLVGMRIRFTISGVPCRKTRPVLAPLPQKVMLRDLLQKIYGLFIKIP